MTMRMIDDDDNGNVHGDVNDGGFSGDNDEDSDDGDIDEMMEPSVPQKPVPEAAAATDDVAVPLPCFAVAEPQRAPSSSNPPSPVQTKPQADVALDEVIEFTHKKREHCQQSHCHQALNRHHQSNHGHLSWMTIVLLVLVKCIHMRPWPWRHAHQQNLHGHKQISAAPQPHMFQWPNVHVPVHHVLLWWAAQCRDRDRARVCVHSESLCVQCDNVVPNRNHNKFNHEAIKLHETLQNEAPQILNAKVGWMSPPEAMKTKRHKHKEKQQCSHLIHSFICSFIHLFIHSFIQKFLFSIKFFILHSSYANFVI